MPTGARTAPGRLLLVLNGAEERLQVALGRITSAPTPSGRDMDSGGQTPSLLCFQEWVVPGHAMQFLAPILENSFDQLGLKPADLDGIACVHGPGSFTGLRVVMATALGLATSLNLPMAGIDYPELLATNAASRLPTPEAEQSLFVLTHSRRNRVYLQQFILTPHGSGANPVPLTPLVDASLDQAAALVEQGVASANAATTPAGPPPAPLLLGSGLRRNASFFQDRFPGAQRLGPWLNNPGGDALLTCAARLEFSRQPMAPLYLRPSDAEENLDAIAAKRGLDPVATRKRLDDLLSS